MHAPRVVFAVIFVAALWLWVGLGSRSVIDGVPDRDVVGANRILSTPLTNTVAREQMVLQEPQQSGEHSASN